MRLSGQDIAPPAAGSLSARAGTMTAVPPSERVSAADRSSTASPGGSQALVLVRGDESLLVDRAISRVVVVARRADPEVEHREAIAAGLTVGEFADLVAPSLFAEPRVVVVRGAQEAVKELAAALLEYAADPVDGVTLVIHHSGGARNKPLADGFVAAGAAVAECARITRVGERLDFVRSEIRAAGGTTSPDAVGALVDAVGTDLRELASAAAQLVADTGGMVDASAVRRYHRGRADVSGFTISDLTMAGDLPAALEALRWALDVGVAQVLIADALADGVRTVAKVTGAGPGNSYALAGQLGMPPWKVDKARSAGRGWTAEGLEAAMLVVAELNAAVKGQAADPDYSLERAVIDLVRTRRRR
jgi:DNA polymerase-3 subunit delta